MENLEPKTRFEYFLNKIATNNSESSEQSGGVLIVPVNITYEGEGAEEKFVYTLTKTYREIKNAGFAVFQIQHEGDNSVEIQIPSLFAQGDENFIILAGEYDYLTDSMDGYPCAKRGR